jgi:hypothetical protein
VPQEKTCFSSLAAILSFIKSAMSGASDGDIFEFELRHDENKPGVIRMEVNSSALEVVPAWFKEWVSSNRTAQA